MKKYDRNFMIMVLQQLLQDYHFRLRGKNVITIADLNNVNSGLSVFKSKRFVANAMKQGFLEKIDCKGINQYRIIQKSLIENKEEK